MDHPPPLPKIAISGATLASLIHRFSTTTSSIEGLLFGHLTYVTPLNLTDDSSETSQTLLATVTGFLTSSSFHDTSGKINASSVRRLIPNSTSLLGWFSGRRRTPLRPSLREFSISSSLSSLSELSSSIKPSPSSSSSSLNFNPCLFFLLASPISDQTSHIHTHDYRAYQFLTGTNSLNPVSIDIINIGPAFRDHYGSFSPNSPFPALDCQLGYTPMVRDNEDERLNKMKQASKDQMELDACVEGLEVSRLSKLMGSEAKNYTQSLEDLYLKMLVKIENLTTLVEQSSARVLEQENHNKKLRQKIMRSAAAE
ncbi:uncharacterized protein LOC131601253 [Vicia villosa]|uniref:uncharacterized protein LOC131601253 n=1 Tax=Vicia villosa TaxID=3911 RepID=UPI00273AFDBE|nr:uncharacterized protein LOC131601253 [Vicia villosa]XP_058729010.1 uncharacterized protein LOC131601253 [Vicia villosa]